MNKSQKGTLLIISVLTLGLLMLLAVYFLTFNLTESKISESQKAAAQTYYLAEAGINEAIWKLKNDSEWSVNFISSSTCEDWEAGFTRSSAIYSNGYYAVSIKNSSCGNGEITATSTLDTANGKAQRVVKTKVFKAESNPISEYNVFTGGHGENIKIRLTDPFYVYDGYLFSNNNLIIRDSSKVYIDGNKKALVRNNITISNDSELTATSCASNVCDAGCLANECPPDSI